MPISFGTASMWPEQMASLIAFNRDLQKMREQFAQQFYSQGIGAIAGSGAGAAIGSAASDIGQKIYQGKVAQEAQRYELQRMQEAAGYQTAAQQREYEQRKGLMNYAAQQELARQGLLQMGAPNAETYRQALQGAGGQGNLEWQQFLEAMGQPGGAPATGAGYAPTPGTPPSYNPLPSIKSGLPMQMPSSVPFEAPYQIPDQELLSVAPPAVRDRWAQLETGQQALRQNYGTGGAYVPQISAAMSGMAAEQNQIRNRLSSQMMSPRMAGPSSFADPNVEGGVFVRGRKGIEWHYEPQLARDRQAQRGRSVSFTDAQGQTRTVQVPGGSAIVMDRWNPNVRYTVEPDGKVNYHEISATAAGDKQAQYDDKQIDAIMRVRQAAAAKTQEPFDYASERHRAEKEYHEGKLPVEDYYRAVAQDDPDVQAIRSIIRDQPDVAPYYIKRELDKIKLSEPGKTRAEMDVGNRALLDVLESLYHESLRRRGLIPASRPVVSSPWITP